MSNKKNQADELGAFVDHLITEKQMTNLDPEVLAGVREDLLNIVEDRINAVILANIPPEKLSYFEQLLDRADENEIQSFCQRNIYDLDKIIAAELVEFKKTYLNIQ